MQYYYSLHLFNGLLWWMGFCAKLICHWLDSIHFINFHTLVWQPQHHIFSSLAKSLHRTVQCCNQDSESCNCLSSGRHLLWLSQQHTLLSCHIMFSIHSLEHVRTKSLTSTLFLSLHLISPRAQNVRLCQWYVYFVFFLRTSLSVGGSDWCNRV